MLMINFKQGQQWEEISPWSRKERGVQEPSAPERLSKVTERPGQREEREEKKPAKDRNQQSEFPLCLHKLAPVWLAAGECVRGGVRGGRSLGNARVAVLHMNEA